MQNDVCGQILPATFYQVTNVPLQVYERRTSNVSQGSPAPFSYPIHTRSLSPDAFEMGRGQVGLRTINGPVEPHLELVFVHGLLGDSNLTWASENDRAMFWPDWLSDDFEFSDMLFMPTDTTSLR